MVVMDMHWNICSQWRNKQKETEIMNLEDEFHVFSHFDIFFLLPALAIYYLSEGSKARLKSFWRQYQLKPPFRLLSSCRCAGLGGFWSILKMVQSITGSTSILPDISWVSVSTYCVVNFICNPAYNNKPAQQCTKAGSSI